MDAAKRQTYKVAPEWVERIFLRLTEIYGCRFTDQFTKPEYREIEKARWSTGLYGLTSAEIRHAIHVCLTSLKDPPNVVEFYHYGKQHRFPPPPKAEEKKCRPEVQAKYMEQIRNKLNGSRGNKGNVAVPANREPVLDDADIPAWLL